MPPKEKLTTNDIAVLAQWIRDGAPWPESQGLGSLPPKSDSTERLGNAWDDPRNPNRRLFGGQRLELWSLPPEQRTNDLKAEIEALEKRISPSAITALKGFGSGNRRFDSIPEQMVLRGHTQVHRFIRPQGVISTAAITSSLFLTLRSPYQFAQFAFGLDNSPDFGSLLHVPTRMSYLLSFRPFAQKDCAPVRT